MKWLLLTRDPLGLMQETLIGDISKQFTLSPPQLHRVSGGSVWCSAANRLIGEVVQSRRRPLQGPSPG